MNTNDPSKPNYIRPEAQAVLPDLDLLADLLAGTRQMWEKAQERKYIRKWSDEKPSVYAIRRQCESVFGGFARVLSAAVGMLWAKLPAMEWNQSEEAMTEQWADLDGADVGGHVLCKRFSDQSIRDGLGLILVDHPNPPADVEVVTEEIAERLNLRPKWALYARHQILSWRVGKVNNRSTPVQIVLAENQYDETGVYGVAPRQRYRVLRVLARPVTNTDPGGPTATWELWEETKDASVLGGFKVIDRGVFRNREGAFAPELPIGVAYTGRTDAPFTATIPLLEVAYANLSHWRKATALSFGTEVASYAQGVIIGDLAQEPGPNGTMIPGTVKMGPLVVLRLQGEGANFKWEAPPVEAFDALERALKEKVEQIGQMGMSFLVSDTRAAETAEAKRLDATAENSTLATAAQGIEDAINAALEWHAWYLGIEKAGAPMMTINKDFDAVAMDPQTMAAYVDAVVRAGLPPRLLLEAWKQGGRLPADTDIEQLEIEMMANQAAEEERKRQEQEDLARRQQPVGAAG
jgi:hypothetical protein